MLRSVQRDSLTSMFMITAKFPYISGPLRSTVIHPNARWMQNGLTVSGGNGMGNGSNQLYYPWGLHVDDDQTVYIADKFNHRIVEWKRDATSGQVVAGGNEQGSGANQLNYAKDVIVDKAKDSLIICDRDNRRVVRWPRRKGAIGETIISNIQCQGLTMDDNGSLYVTDSEKHEVRRYRIGESQGTVVAGSNGKGNRLDQLNSPQYVFVDREHSVYVSDEYNHRVMKWVEGAKQGIVVAGGQGTGEDLTQLYFPQGVVVDQLGTVYVADFVNNRIMRWPKGATQGYVIVGGNGQGERSNQLYYPIDLAFDRDGNLYIDDQSNHRVQKFNIEAS
jgi:sugar lactone lactonase YvrE